MFWSFRHFLNINLLFYPILKENPFLLTGDQMESNFEVGASAPQPIGPSPLNVKLVLRHFPHRQFPPYNYKNDSPSIVTFPHIFTRNC